MINWNTILSNIETNRSRDITVDPSIWDPNNPEYAKILELWNRHGVNTDSVKWTNYYLDVQIQELFAEQIGCLALRSWVSRIDPGYMTGWHWDVDENEAVYKNAGNVVRYTYFLDKPKLGHMFLIDDQYYVNVPQGTLVQWKNYTDWHCGTNGGLEPFYMYHLIAIKRP